MPNLALALPTDTTPAERRSFPRFEIALSGLCSINLGPDIPCASLDLSIAGISLQTNVQVTLYDAVIASFREFGLVRGRVARRFEGGFAIALNTVDPYRSRLSRYLGWRVGAGEGPLDEMRRDERLVPFNRLAMLKRNDGATMVGLVENVSRSGIFFKSTATFSIGEAVEVGPYRATVVRVLDEGAAAEFDTVLPPEKFDKMISFARPD